MAFRLVVVALSSCAFLLTGCAMQTTAGPSLGTQPAGMKGIVHGGQQAVLGATVSVYEVGSSGYGVASTTPKATTTTSVVDGSFSFAAGAYTCTASNTPMYIVATGGTPGGYSANANLALMAAIPQCAAGKTSSLVINEVTTAATIVAVGQFLGTGLGAGVVPQIGGTCSGCATGVYNQGMVNAFSNTYPQLVNNATGAAVTSGTTNGITITTEASKLYTIANVLAACVNSTGATSTTEITTTCGKLFTDVNETGASPRPADTIQAGLQMALYPWWNVSTVYALGSSTPPFVGVSSTPNDWTVAISYAYPTMSVGVSGSSTHITSMNLDIDSSGRIWFPSTQSGAVGVGYFDPATTSFNGPYNSTGSPLVQPQFLAIDTVGYVWATDISGTNIEGFNTTSPTSAPTVLSVGHSPVGVIGVGLSDELYAMTPYYSSGSYRPQEITITSSRSSPSVANSNNNSTLAGPGVVATGIGLYSENGTVDYPQFLSSGGSPYLGCVIGSPYNTPLANRVTGSTTYCNSGGAATYHTSGVVSSMVTVTSAGQFGGPGFSTFYTPALTMSSPEGVAVDGNNQVWVANSGNSSITTYSFPYNVAYTTQVSQTATVPYLHDATHGNTLTDPFALGIDASGNVWTISPGCVSGATVCTPNGMVLTNMVGVASPTITPVGAQIVNSTVGTKPAS